VNASCIPYLLQLHETHVRNTCFAFFRRADAHNLRSIVVNFIEKNKATAHRICLYSWSADSDAVGTDHNQFGSREFQAVPRMDEYKKSLHGNVDATKRAHRAQSIEANIQSASNSQLCQDHEVPDHNRNHSTQIESLELQLSGAQHRIDELESAVDDLNQRMSVIESLLSSLPQNLEQQPQILGQEAEHSAERAEREEFLSASNCDGTLPLSPTSELLDVHD